jgi:hypothetical protein
MMATLTSEFKDYAFVERTPPGEALLVLELVWLVYLIATSLSAATSGWA